MKHLALTVFLIFAIDGLLGQSDPTFSQYFLNAPTVNPAFTGIEDFWDIKLMYRNQWVDRAEAPKTNYFGVYGALYRKDPASFKDNSLRVSDPIYYNEFEKIRNELSKHGLGGFVITRTEGAFDQLFANLNYALHIPLSTRYRLTLGTGLGIERKRIDANGLTVRDPDNDLLYQSIVNGQTSETNFTISLGGLLYSSKFHLGISGVPVVHAPISDAVFDDSDSKLAYVLVSGYRKPLGPSFSVTPGIMLRFQSPFPFYYHPNVRFRYQETLWLGFGYKSTKEVNAMFGLFLSNKFSINYSYDTSISKQESVGGVTHEISAGLALKKKNNSTRYMW